MNTEQEKYGENCFRPRMIIRIHYDDTFLLNRPAHFKRLMNEILRHYINKFLVVYLDDFFMYIENAEEHDTI